MAILVLTPKLKVSYSPKARLLLLEPLGTNGLSPLGSSGTANLRLIIAAVIIFSLPESASTERRKIL
jgi:hypothetical protein